MRWWLIEIHAWLTIYCVSFQALSEIGLVIFTALDFGLGQDQERALSEDLENLLELLASEGQYRKRDNLLICKSDHLKWLYIKVDFGHFRPFLTSWGDFQQ